MRAHLNSFHPTIKFTSECGTKEVSFLDTAISFHRGKLVSNLFTKPTDSHSYLLYSLCHPKHTKEGIPYSQLIRVRRICTFTMDFIENAHILMKHFKRRGYPEDILQDAFDRCLDADRLELLQKQPDKKKTTEQDKIFLTTTYSPGLKAPLNIIKENWPLLGTSNLTTELFESTIVNGHRRCTNLQDDFVRARVPSQDTQDLKSSTTSKACKSKNCNYCPKLNKSGRIKSTYTGRTYSSKYNVSCNSSNIIYCITCKTCGKQYVGQTKRKLLKDRCVQHFYHIKKIDRSYPIGRHFNLPNHNGINDVELHIVDFIHSHPASLTAVKLCDIIKKTWILRLRTSSPHGINTMNVKYKNN